ncbi:MAG: ribosome recycling factor [Anaerolineae bacterium]|nr:ribosome recycling factor [Anaerolineae bacterium]
MIDDVLAEAKGGMGKSIDSLQHDLATLRTGRASPGLVDKLVVEYYGTQTPLREIASVSVPEAQLLAIRPYDPSALKTIERAILQSDLGLTPNNDGKLIRLQIPTLTEERRRELSKAVAKRVEEAKVAIRNIRRSGLEDLRSFEKESLITEDDFYDGKDQLQELTDDYIKKVDEIGAAKEKEIMEV